MNRWSGKQLTITLLACGISVAVALLLCIAVGSSGTGWPGVEVRAFVSKRC